MEKIVLIILIILIALGAYFFFFFNSSEPPADEGKTEITPAPSNGYENQGMKIEIITEGTGEEAKNKDTVTVHYVGTFENGNKFDSSIDRGIPFSFILGAGRVIKGWDLGVLGMKVGEKRKLTIPPEFAYGATGTPGGPIPPNATLIFEVELLSIGQWGDN